MVLSQADKMVLSRMVSLESLGFYMLFGLLYQDFRALLRQLSMRLARNLQNWLL